METKETVAYSKPVPPRRDPLVREFYDWLKMHELRLQRCKSCGTWRHMPRPMCSKCGSLEWEWSRSSGKGTVYTWTTTHQAMDPAFTDIVPYAAVVVELEEGPRLLSFVDCPPEELKIDMSVEVYFDDVTTDISFAKFRPVPE